MPPPPRDSVLLADDDSLSREFLAEALAALDLEVTAVASGDAALQALGARAFDLVVTDLKMPGADGFAVLRAAKRRDPPPPVVLVTAHGTLHVAVEALRGGADDILQKPVGLEELELTLARVRERARLVGENRRLRQQGAGSQLVCVDPAMRRIRDLVGRVAKSKATVLIGGESGTGKERIAALVHQESDRADGPFVKINCAGLAETLLESELFGHEAGAFTGAARRRPGCFELADRGTLLLDEVGETSPKMQSKLLRVLQEGEVQRVGGTKPLAVDVRIVAATNRDLRAEVAAGRFREDLFYRLAVVPIELPPLRARRAEIVPLANAFLSRGARLSADAEELLLAHAWPGNVRELQNLIERASLLCESGVIDAALIAPWLGLGPVLRPLPRADGPLDVGPLVGRPLAAVESELIDATLARCGGNRTRAAAMLGIGVRTLFNKLTARAQPAAPNRAPAP